jgi:hypothetical protein
MRKATQNASVAAFAPKTLLITMSRSSPNTRLIMVMLLKEATERSMDGRARADSANDPGAGPGFGEPEPGI